MKKLYIETYGCQMNVADSETVASIMKMADYTMPSRRYCTAWKPSMPADAKGAASSSGCWAAWPKG